MTSIAIVILNWNGTSDTLACLASISSANSRGLDIIVIDNGSDADPTAEIKSIYPSATVTRLKRNVGFAAALGARLHALYHLIKKPENNFR